MSKKEASASLVGNVSLGGEVSVHRLGFGAMRLTGEGIWGPPRDRKAALGFVDDPESRRPSRGCVIAS